MPFSRPRTTLDRIYVIVFARRSIQPERRAASCGPTWVNRERNLLSRITVLWICRPLRFLSSTRASPCNYAQVLEATIDPSHRLILHTGSLGSTYNKDSGGGLVTDISATSFSSDDLDPTCEVRDTTFGCDGLAILDAEVDGQPAKYVRMHTWIMPFTVLTSRQTAIFIVPIDDEHHYSSP